MLVFLRKFLNLKPNPRFDKSDSYVFTSNNLPTQMFGDATVLQTILAGSDVQSLFSAHSSIGAELVKRAD